MAKSWSEYFEESMKSCNLPCPQSLYISASVALSHIGGMINALKIVVASKDAIKLGTLITEARKTSLAASLGSAAIGELIQIAGSVLASFYIGALIGAAIYATEKSYMGWSDKLIDWMTATNDFNTLASRAQNYGVVATYRSKSSETAIAGNGTIRRIAPDTRTGTLPENPQSGWPMTIYQV